MAKKKGQVKGINKILFGTVVSSRVRLARDLKDFVYPVSMKTEKERAKTVAVIEKAMIRADGKVDDKYNFAMMTTRRLPLDRRALLEESGVLPHMQPNAKENTVITTDVASLSAITNYVDHLRLSSIHNGLNLEKCYGELKTLDELLQECGLEYAKDENMGYFTGNIKDAGTGAKFSVRVNLLTTFRTGKIKEVKRLLDKFDMTLTASFPSVSDEDYPAGCFFDISTTGTMDYSCEDRISMFNDLCVNLEAMEKNLLDGVMRFNSDTIVNSIYRAYYISKHSLLVSQREAIDVVSDMRIGLMLGIISGTTYEKLYKLLLNVQYGHLRCELFDPEYDSKDEDVRMGFFNIDKFRAKVLRDAFESIKLDENWRKKD